MAHLLLHYNGAYNVYLTNTNSVMYDHALSLDEVKVLLGKTKDLQQRLDRAHATGCSTTTLEQCVANNRAAEDGSHVPMDEFIQRWLTIPGTRS